MNDICSKYQPKSSYKSKNGGNKEERKSDNRPKKKKVPQDPNAPKKPTTNVYLLYCNERRPHLLEERPELKNDPQGLARIAGDEWKSLPGDTKKMYYEKAAVLKEQYESELAKNNLRLEEEGKRTKLNAPLDLMATQSDNGDQKYTPKEQVLKIGESAKNSDNESSSFASSEDEGGSQNDENAGSRNKALASSSEEETDVVEPKLNKKVKKH